MIVSEQIYIWALTVLVVSTSLAWLVVDIVRLRRALADEATTLGERQYRHDRIFGSIIGLVVAIIGIVGMLRLHFG